MKKVRFNHPEQPPLQALAIVSAEKDYRISFQLNRLLQWNLAHSEMGIRLRTGAIPELTVSCQRFTDPQTEATYFLIKNRQPDAFLLPAMRQADYIFFIAGEESGAAADKLKACLAGLSFIQSTFAIPAEQLKNIEINAE